MIDMLYDQIVVKLASGGSGVLCQPNTKAFSYFITAKHCIFEEDENCSSAVQKISLSRQLAGVMTQLDCNVLESLIIEDVDLIVFKLAYIEGIPSYNICFSERSQDIKIVGFPKAFDNSVSKYLRYNLGGNINARPDGSAIQIDADRGLETNESAAKDLVSGYSGSGVFVEDNDEVYLCGIATDIGSHEGAFGVINGLDVSILQNKLSEKDWALLPSIETSSFSLYKRGVKEIIDSPLIGICLAQLTNIENHITPKDIINHCGNKLVWPYSDVSINRGDIWEGWLLYLMFRSIHNPDSIKDKSFYIFNDGDSCRKIKLIYSTKTNKLPDFLKEYLQDAYEDSNNQDIIIMRSKAPSSKKIMKSHEINEMVTDISEALFNEGKLQIDQANNSKEFSLIHIGKIIDELQNCSDTLEIEKRGKKSLAAEFGRCIGGMFCEL